jgi:hypothetical protein
MRFFNEGRENGWKKAGKDLSELDNRSRFQRVCGHLCR